VSEPRAFEDIVHERAGYELILRLHQFGLLTDDDLGNDARLADVHDEYRETLTNLVALFTQNVIAPKTAIYAVIDVARRSCPSPPT
jgi:hypothetical protein